MIRCAIALLVSCLLCLAAAAKDAKIGEVSLHLPQPPGYCEMDAVLASDARLIADIHGALGKTGNRLLILSADCGELRDWRDGKRSALDHMAQYQTVRSLEDRPLADTPEKVVKGYCDEMRALGQQSTPGMTPDALRGNEIKFLGVVGEDPLVCYSSLLQKFATDVGERTQVTVFATTVLKGKIVLYYLFAPYVGGETVTQMLVKQRANVGQLRRANRH